MTTVTGVPAGTSPAPYQPAATAQPRSADAARQPEAALRSEVTVPADAAASSPADMLQGLVSIFGGNISQLDPSNITKESLRQAGVNMTESLFDLIDNGMKLADERSGAADGKISEEEISLFFNNVNTFRQMAQLPETDAEFARVARLYNKEGGDYTRISISDYQRIAEHITQQWEAAGSADPYEKAAQVIGNGVQAAQISPMLDMISRKLNRADYKDAQPEVQKSVLSAFLLASSLQMDIVELYGMGEIERIDHTDDGGQVTLTAHNQANRGAPVISLGSEAITDEEVGSLMKANMDKEIKSEAGLVLGPKGKAQMIFQSLVAGKAGQAFLKELAVSNVTEEEAITWLSKQQGNSPATPENIEIARMNVFEEKCKKDKALEAETTKKLGQSMDALRVTDMEGLVTSINSAIADPAQQVTAQDINGWIDEAKKGMKQITEIMQAQTGTVNPVPSAPGRSSAPAPTAADAPEAEPNPNRQAAVKLFDEYKAAEIAPEYVGNNALDVMKKGADSVNQHHSYFSGQINTIEDDNNKRSAKLFILLTDPAGITAPLRNGNLGQADGDGFAKAVSGLNDAELDAVTDVLFEIGRTSTLSLTAYLGKISGGIDGVQGKEQASRITRELWTRHYEAMAKSANLDMGEFVEGLKNTCAAFPDSIDLDRVKNAVPQARREEVNQTIVSIREMTEQNTAEGEVLNKLAYAD